MKKFIINLSYFSIIPLLFVLCFDLYLRNIDTLYSKKYDGLMEEKQDVEVLFLGNSRAHYGVNPAYFKNYNAYNLANVSQSIYFDKRLTVKAMEEGVSRLKYVFISVDYHSLVSSSQGTRNVWSYYANGIKYKDQDYTKAMISPFLWGYTPKVSTMILLRHVKKKIQYGNSAVNFEVERAVNVRDSLCSGFIGLEGTNNSSFNPIDYERRAYHFRENVKNSDRKEIVEDLSDFISFLKKKNIEPILYSLPTFKDFNEYLDKGQIKRNLDDINMICSKFNLQYWRFDEDSSFSKEDFYNQDHLNKEGAKKFSIMLNNKLEEYDKTRVHSQFAQDVI